MDELRDLEHMGEHLPALVTLYLMAEWSDKIAACRPLLWRSRFFEYVAAGLKPLRDQLLDLSIDVNLPEPEPGHLPETWPTLMLSEATALVTACPMLRAFVVRLPTMPQRHPKQEWSPEVLHRVTAGLPHLREFEIVVPMKPNGDVCHILQKLPRLHRFLEVCFRPSETFQRGPAASAPPPTDYSPAATSLMRLYLGYSAVPTASIPLLSVMPHCGVFALDGFCDISLLATLEFAIHRPLALTEATALLSYPGMQSQAYDVHSVDEEYFSRHHPPLESIDLRRPPPSFQHLARVYAQAAACAITPESVSSQQRYSELTFRGVPISLMPHGTSDICVGLSGHRLFFVKAGTPQARTMRSTFRERWSDTTF